MQIFVREVASGIKHVFDVEGMYFIAQLKEAITTKFGLPIEKQQLLYGGIVLENNKSLMDYDVVPETTLILMQANVWTCKCTII